MVIYPKCLDALLYKENQYFLQAAAECDQSLIHILLQSLWMCF